MSIKIVVISAMNYVEMYFSSPVAHPNVIDTTICDSNLVTSIDHRMSYQDKETIATEEPMFLSHLYEYIVHVFDTNGHMTTLIAYEPCQLVIICEMVL